MTRVDDRNRDDLSARRTELTAAVRSSTAEEAIRQLVHSMVDEMKRTGEPPEKVVISIKTAVLSGFDAIPTKDPEERAVSEKVLRACLGWGVKRYYEATE